MLSFESSCAHKFFSKCMGAWSLFGIQLKVFNIPLIYPEVQVRKSVG